ncbi:hypothetical protein GCM10010988_07810 [Cnuibacter physcomitrellae]|nr:hypothetical protein GCM10010988_07810 [Cnuibacter physcomitrellae]
MAAMIPPTTSQMVPVEVVSEGWLVTLVGSSSSLIVCLASSYARRFGSVTVAAMCLGRGISSPEHLQTEEDRWGDTRDGCWRRDSERG